MRYWYANGRPSRVEAATVSNDLQTLNYYTTYYIEYNWHGDATNFVTSDGIGGSGATLYNPWGSGISAGPSWNYYGWDGGWGYLSFPSLGLYYVHGRWYNPDIGRFISPDAKGDYRYGSGDDPTNQAWISDSTNLNAPTRDGGQGNSYALSSGEPPQLLRGIEAHIRIEALCIAMNPACRINRWTGRGFADIVILFDVYEIKPYTKYGISNGPAQVRRYVNELTTKDHMTYRIGMTWSPNVEMSMLDGSPLSVFTLYDVYPGVIFYQVGPRSRDIETQLKFVMLEELLRNMKLLQILRGDPSVLPHITVPHIPPRTAGTGIPSFLPLPVNPWVTVPVIP